MATTNGIKINDIVLNNNNIFKFVTVIDFHYTEDIMFLPVRITKHNEEEIHRRVDYLKSQKRQTARWILATYQQILEQLPTVRDPNIWETKSELIVWVKFDIHQLFPNLPVRRDRDVVYHRLINEERLNFFINTLYFYDNFGVEDPNNTYHIVDDLDLLGIPIFLPFGQIIHKQYLYFFKPFGNERFYSMEFAHTDYKFFNRQIPTKPIVHTFYPSKLNLDGKTDIEKAKIDTMRLYIYDTSSSSLSSTEKQDINNVNLSYLPILNNYDYGAINYFNPNIDYATNYKDFYKSSIKSDPSEIKGDIVTKREILKNKLKLFNSQELTLRIAGAVSLSGRLQWSATGYKYKDEKRYSSLVYSLRTEKLNFDNNGNQEEEFLRVSNINFDLFKSAMPVQIHTPPARNRSVYESYETGDPDHYEYTPPVFFRVKDAHSLDVVITTVDLHSYRLPYSLTTFASHIFFIDVSIIDDILNNHQNTFSHSIPLHLQK